MKNNDVWKKMISIGAAVLVSAALAACGSSGSTAPTGGASETSTGAGGGAEAPAQTEGEESGIPEEIRIGYWASPNSELLVKQTGTLEKAYPDTKVSWVEFSSGADILTAIQAGSIDLSTIGTHPGTTGIVNEYPFYVYYLEDIIGESEGLIVREDSGIETLADLEGRTIATSFSTTSHFSFLKALEQAGIDSKSINIMDMDASNIYAAWDRGDIDGAYIWESVKSQILNDGGKEIISSAEVADQGAVTGEFGIVHKDFYAKYPDVIRTYVDLLDEATDLFNNDSENAAAILSTGLGLTEEEALKAMSGIREITKEEQTEYFGTPEAPGQLPQILKDTASFLYSQGKLTADPEISVFQDAILTEIYQ